MPPLQKQLRVVDRGGIRFIGRQSFHARAEAAVDMKLQARMCVPAVEVDPAGRNFEMPVNELHHAICQIGGKIGTVIARSIAD